MLFKFTSVAYVYINIIEKGKLCSYYFSNRKLIIWLFNAPRITIHFLACVHIYRIYYQYVGKSKQTCLDRIDLSGYWSLDSNSADIYTAKSVKTFNGTFILSLLPIFTLSFDELEMMLNQDQIAVIVIPSFIYLILHWHDAEPGSDCCNCNP